MRRYRMRDREHTRQALAAGRMEALGHGHAEDGAVAYATQDFGGLFHNPEGKG